MSSSAPLVASRLSRALTVHQLEDALAAAAAELGAPCYELALTLGPPGAGPSMVLPKRADSGCRLTTYPNPSELPIPRLQLAQDTTACADGHDLNVYRALTVDLHFNPQHHFALGIAWPEGWAPGKPADLQQVAVDLHLFCMHAEQAAQRICGRLSGRASPWTRLTPKQKELRSWLVKGLPDHLIALLLGMTTADYNKAHQEMLAATGTRTAAEAAALVATDPAFTLEDDDN